MQSPDFNAWLDQAYGGFRVAWQSTDELIKDLPDRGYDLVSGRVTFFRDQVARLTATLQVVGTTGANGDWLWAWANENLPANVTRSANDARQFGIANGFEWLSMDHIQRNTAVDFGWDMAVATAHLTHAQGIVTFPYGGDDRLMFVLLYDLTAVGPN